MRKGLFIKHMSNTILTLEETDKRILRELLKNSRRSNRQLAAELGIATSTVIKRIGNMESQGIIKKYSVTLDQKKLGYEITAVIEVIAAKGKLKEMENKIASLPNIYEVYDMTGTADAIIIGSFKNTDELSELTKNLLDMPRVGRANTHVVLSKVKEDFSSLL